MIRLTLHGTAWVEIPASRSNEHIKMSTVSSIAAGTPVIADQSDLRMWLFYSDISDLV